MKVGVSGHGRHGGSREGKAALPQAARRHEGKRGLSSGLCYTPASLFGVLANSGIDGRKAFLLRPATSFSPLKMPGEKRGCLSIPPRNRPPH